jgi:hypothetical protein
MALGSYNLSLSRQAYHYYVTPQQPRIGRGWWWEAMHYYIYVAGVAPDGVDLSTAVGEPTVAVSVEAMSPTGVDFETLVGSIRIKNSLGVTGVDFLTSVGSITEITEQFSVAKIGHDADSFFLSRNASTNPQSMQLEFTWVNSDLSDRVVRYPTISRGYKDVVGKDWSVTMENASQLMNTVISDRTLFRNAAGEVRFGYIEDTSPYSYNALSMGGGFLSRVSYEGNLATLSFRDRMNILSQTFLSTETQSRTGVYFDNAEYNPADLVWTALTANSFGAKFSSVDCYTNPQINYDSWLTWKNTIGSESITCRGFIPYGTNYLQFLQNVAEMTDSAIYVEADNRLYFKRNLTGVVSFSATVSEADIISIRTSGEAYDMCNRYTMPLSITVQSNAALTDAPNAFVTFANSASVNSFGAVTKEPTQSYIWYTNSATAKNLADRILYRRRIPEIAVNVTVPMKYQQQQLGDIIYLYSDEIGFQDQAYTLIETRVSLENLTMELELSSGHGIAIANVTVFELNDVDLGTLDGTIGVLG